MRLYNSPGSPYGRKVMVLLQETGQVDDIEIVPAMGSPLHPEKMPLDHNPLGKIPALVIEGGISLFDSRVICRFLDDKAGGQLYPVAPTLYQTLTLEATSDGIVDATVLMIYEKRLRSEALYWDQWVDAQWSKIYRALDALETRWIDHLNGQFDMGHVATGCALSFLDVRLPDRNWRSGRPKLDVWEKQFADRKAMRSTLAPA